MNARVYDCVEATGEREFNLNANDLRIEYLFRDLKTSCSGNPIYHFLGVLASFFDFGQLKSPLFSFRKSPIANQYFRILHSEILSQKKETFLTFINY